MAGQYMALSLSRLRSHAMWCVCAAVAGSLVANAPHLPVHLGAMSEAVRFQVAYYGPGGEGEAEGLQVRGGGGSS
jgi:N-methylhydantoinase B/oxoprolinase/acetone carboxylase alpha subunit